MPIISPLRPVILWANTVVQFPVTLLMAGSTNPMQSRIDNGEVIVTYADGSTARLALANPETWWPIEQDYFIDDFQFRDDAPLPMRVAG